MLFLKPLATRKLLEIEQEVYLITVESGKKETFYSETVMHQCDCSYAVAEGSCVNCINGEEVLQSKSIDYLIIYDMA